MLESLVDEIPVGSNDNIKIIGLDDENVEEPWTLPLLLGKDVNGGDQQWQISFDGTNLVTTYGKVGGTLQTVSRAVITNTSGRNIYQQALLEGKRRFMDKCLEGYHTEGSDTGVSVKPMLAKEFEYKPSQLKDWCAIYYQPKLDGVRCMISNTSNGIVKMSRSNRYYSFLEHLDYPCQLLLSVLPAGCYLDGELYVHGMPFEAITSIVRRTKERHPDEGVMQYWVFDILVPGVELTFEQRYEMLFDAYEKVKSHISEIVLVPLYRLDNTAEITSQLEVFCNAGYEGLILRKTGPKSQYVMGRCSNIFKVKKFITAEAIVVAVFPAEGTEASCAMFKLFDPELGCQFDIRPAGSFEQRAYWLQHPELIIGKPYTYKCFSRVPVPRFPVGVGFRDYE